MNVNETLLGGHSPEEFLREYWQKKPLLIRGALPEFESPLSPEELAGLACEEDTESRLILERGGEYPWQLRHGPFEEADFTSLPATHWTLLVQEVDRWVPDVAELLNHFRFIPNWRIDDVMVSYAPDGGNVGAHVDNYDVFLLQGMGRREWRIGMTPMDEEDLVPDVEVSMLRKFDPDETWILEAGDMLYLPPRLPHHGIALSNSMTYSIGFRAPSHEEILAGFVNHVLEGIDPLERYADPDLELQENPGLIGTRALDRIRGILRDAIRDEEMDRWFGSWITQPKRFDLIYPSDHPWRGHELAQAIREGAELARVTPTRFAYIADDGAEVSLFVHGDEIVLERDLAFAAPLLSGSDPLTRETLEEHLADPDFATLLSELVNDGRLEVVH